MAVASRPRKRPSATKIEQSTSMPLLRRRPAWALLEKHYQKLKAVHLRQLFADDRKRGESLAIEAAGLYLDYSKNRITDETIRLLLQLARESELRERIDAMFRGDKINVSENRAVLHVALRAPRGSTIMHDGRNVVPEVHAVLDRMADFANRLRSGAWKGHTGKRISNVINIGIGGSDLGPVMAYEALKHYSERAMTFRFMSNVDGTDFAEAVRDLDPAETLFIVSSKRVIYDGFLAALAAGVPKEKAGILVDEQFGAAILRDAASNNVVTACPWKIEGLDRREDCEEIVTVAR